MLVKWITCDVPSSMQPEFSEAQRAWELVAAVRGFICQFGGFTADRAHILSLWEDLHAYTSFMNSTHDEVADKNRQRRFYESIRVELFSEVLGMYSADAASIAEALSSAKYLRIADCLVRESRRKHFVEMQASVWHPGMAAGGMLAGSFSEHVRDRDRLLVATLWRSEAAHHEYVQHVFPKLYEQSRPKDDLADISGDSFRLEPSWTLRPIR